MRLAILLLAAVAAAPAEFLELRIVFEGTDCLSCAESLEPRLARVRGVEKVELDLETSTIRLALAVGNKVRLGPLEARITQDGTKIASIEAVCRGAVVGGDGGPSLQPDGLTEALPLAGAELPPAGAHGEAAGRILDGRFELEKWRPDPKER
ncbi:MAG: hypothetical protein GC160_22890 [Acidobacteria bacterium]|nr:hypothetical protein [Acidobacteriota bacterium]